MTNEEIKKLADGYYAGNEDWINKDQEKDTKVGWRQGFAYALRQFAVSGLLPLTKEHQCFERGHAFYLVCEIDNGRSKYGDHKCSRCGHVESFQYDYGS